MTSFAGSRTIPMARTELRLFLIADHIVCWLKNFYLWINNWNNIFFNKNRGEKIPPAIIEITFANSLAYLPSCSCKQACSQIGHFFFADFAEFTKKCLFADPRTSLLASEAETYKTNFHCSWSRWFVQIYFSFLKWNRNKHTDLARWNYIVPLCGMLLLTNACILPCPLFDS